MEHRDMNISRYQNISAIAIVLNVLIFQLNVLLCLPIFYALENNLCIQSTCISSYILFNFSIYTRCFIRIFQFFMHDSFLSYIPKTSKINFWKNTVFLFSVLALVMQEIIFFTNILIYVFILSFKEISVYYLIPIITIIFFHFIFKLMYSVDIEPQQVLKFLERIDE